MISDSERAKLQVGYKQTMRALNEKKALKVFLAMDSDDKIIHSIKEHCNNDGVKIQEIETMHRLGKLCNIEVKASCAVVLK